MIERSAILMSEPAAGGLRRPPRLSDVELARVHAELERLAADPRLKERRVAARVSFKPELTVELTIEHPAGGSAKSLALAVDISEGGVCVLHDGFLHIGSKCVVTVRTRDKQTHVLEGAVAACRHCVRACHIIGVKFAKRADLRPFVKDSQAAAAGMTAEPIDPASLQGRMIAIESQPIDVELLQVMLQDTRIALDIVADAGAALERLREEPIDVITCELADDLGNDGGAIRVLRDAGFRRPIVVITGITDPARLADAGRAGAADVVRKPFESALLLRVLRQHLATVAVPVGTEPIVTALPPDLALKRRVPKYVERVKESADALNAAVRGGDFPSARTICQTLRVSADAYGFPILSEATRLALASLDASQSVDESRDDLFRAIQVGRRLSPATSASTTPGWVT